MLSYADATIPGFLHTGFAISYSSKILPLYQCLKGQALLETQISPVFGLTLLDLLELVAIATVLSGVAAVVGIVLSTISLKKSASTSEKQSKIDSANLTLELLRPWRTKQLKELLAKISDKSITEHDKKELEGYLNQLEDIAIFWQDGTLDENHVKEFFASSIKNISNEPFIMNYIKTWSDKNPDYYFVNLNKLINKTKEWKI